MICLHCEERFSGHVAHVRHLETCAAQADLRAALVPRGTDDSLPGPLYPEEEL